MAENNLQGRGRRKRPWRKALQRSERDSDAMKSDDGASPAKRPAFQSQTPGVGGGTRAAETRSVTQNQPTSYTENSMHTSPGTSGLSGAHISQSSSVCFSAGPDLVPPKRPRITAPPSSPDPFPPSKRPRITAPSPRPDPVPSKRPRITAPSMSPNSGPSSNGKGRKGKNKNRDSFLQSPSALDILMLSSEGEGNIGKRAEWMGRGGRGAGGRGHGGGRGRGRGSGGRRGGKAGKVAEIRRQSSSRFTGREQAYEEPNGEVLTYDFCMPEDLKRLLDATIGHQVSQLMGNPSFGHFLNKPSIDPISLPLIVQLLSSTASCELPTLQRQTVRCVIPKIFEAENQGFLNSLRCYLCSLPMTAIFSERVGSVCFLGNICKLFKVLLASENTCVPASTKLPVDALWGATRQLTDQEIRFQDLHEKAQQLLEMRDGIRMTLYETSEERAYKNDYTVLPTRDELEQTTSPLTLQKNIIDGPYPSVAEYLGIQYHLLREDFIHPLRCALHKIHSEEEESLDVKVYNNVHFQDCVFSLYEGSAFEITFEVPGHSHIKWDRSKRFTYGSLLCLMDDNFSTILFATVTERDVDKLRDGILVIKLETEIDGLALSRKTAYRMIESPGFYAAYAPVLRHLHEVDPKKLPFSKYIVECETNIDLPAYVKDKEEFKLNLTHLTGDEEGDYSAVNILEKPVWSDIPMPTLDDSQKEALYSALTRELAIIQGPPGTGKTYIGLKIVETLLRNRNRWDSGTAAVGAPKSPIVVVCYTNHALDQFLEGIIRLKGHSIDQNTQIRRVGGRSKSDLVNEYNIRHYVRKSLHEQRIFGFWKKKNYQLRQRIDALEDLLHCEYDGKKLKHYASFMGPDICYLLQRYYDLSHCSSSIDLATWLDPDRFQLAQKRVTFYSHHQTIEDDRKLVSADIEEDNVTELFEYFEKGVLEEFFKKFAEVKPLSQSEAEFMEECPNNDEIAPYFRMKVFKYCLQMLLKPELEKQLELGNQREKEYERQKQMTMIRCLQQADVIGLTTTGAAKHHPILSKPEAKVVIIEEAAEVLEAHVVSTLTQSTEHLILIGDHQQLRPKTNDYILARDYHLAISLFERLVRNNFPHISLQVQHRMRPEISAMVSANIYGNALEDAPSTEEYPAVDGMKCNMFFVHHEAKETPNTDLKSPKNDHEANFLARLCKYLLQQGYREEQVTVITPYTGQMYNLRDKFFEMSKVKITPIDSYQGEENDIILLSLVRSEKPGFVKDENRICVALSRAKHGLYVIGNFKLFCSSSNLWRSIVQGLQTQDKIGQSLPLECQKHQTITEVANAEDFDQVCNGGCTLPCNYRLPCNHMCPYKCHPGNEQHYMPCKRPCAEYCPQRHRCKKLCHEPCGRCVELVEKTIPQCGHLQQVPCHRDPEDFMCQEPCSKVLPCGHKCKKKCGEEHTTECRELITREWPCEHTAQAECYWTEDMYSRNCKVECKVTLQCGHPCQGTCGECRQGRLHKPCKQKCDRRLTCGHQCKIKCAQNCPPCDKKCMFQCPHGPCGHKCHELCRPCAHKCEVKCEHQQCTRNCGEQCNIEPCNEPCLQTLPCKHPCMGVCGETCPDVCRVCDKETFNDKVPIIFGTEDPDDPELRIIQLDCGHKFDVKSMDQWMQEDQEGKVQWKACFLCNAPILKTQRYIKIIKAIKDDLNEVKKKELTLTTNERENLRHTLTDMARYSRLSRNPERFITDISKISDRRLYAEHSIFAAERSVRKATEHEGEEMDTGYLLQQQTKRKELWAAIERLKKQCQDFIGKLERYRCQLSITEQMLHDIEAEKNRICLLSAVHQIELQIMRAKVKLSDHDLQQLKTFRSNYETKGNQICTLSVAEYNSSMSYIEDVKKKYHLVGIAPWEKQMILTAMHAKPGSWYKCRNGHIYNIGECGGAMVRSRCPECGATIGGSNHQLHSDNVHAGEFDNSRQAAWSEMANLHNFDPQDF